MTERPDALLHEFVQQGFDALAAGDPDRAIAVCKEALARHPGMARAHYLAALIALEGGNPAAALPPLEATVSLNPRHAAAWAQLARAHLMRGAFVRAEECLRNAARLERGNPDTMDLIGTVFRLAGNLDASRQWHEKAVRRAPAQTAFRVNLANSRLYFGDREGAATLLRDCLADEPDNPQLHWLLAGTLRADDDAHIEAMRELARRETHPRAAAYLHYAIGKECEDLERWDEAFAAYAAGAALRRQTVAFDEAAEEAIYEAALAEFTPEWFERRPDGVADAAPIFIVGEPRSGTTLLDRMLAAHPAVTSAGELRHFGFAVRAVTGIDEPRQFSAQLVRAGAEADVTRVAGEYLRSTAAVRSTTPHFIDKMPTNSLWLPLILAALPAARVLVLEREPMDACFAAFKQLFADAYLWSYTQEECARHHARYRRLIETWSSRFPGRLHSVRYEDLVSDTEATLRNVLAYAGLSWQPACLAFDAAPTGVATASAAQVREPPHTRSVGRWRRYGDSLQPMRAALEKAGVPVTGG